MRIQYMGKKPKNGPAVIIGPFHMAAASESSAHGNAAAASLACTAARETCPGAVPSVAHRFRGAYA